MAREFPFYSMVIVLVLAIIGGFQPVTADGTCRAFLWFDLGNVLVETRDGFDHLHWMTGAHEMLEKLKAKGCAVGLISNVPESWGAPGDPDSKIAHLQKVLNGGWIGSTPIFLNHFDKIFLPAVQEQAKPAEFLFKKAHEWAARQGKTSLFQGESPREVQTAKAVGMDSFLVEFDSTGRIPRYFPIDRLLNGDRR